jgi:hypothetical protein
MTKKIVLLLAVLLALLTANGLAQPPQPTDSSPCGKVDPRQVRVPADFSLQYASGPSNPGRGATVIQKVTAAGEFTVSKWRRRQGLPVVVKQSHIPAEAVKRIYAQVLGCRFFELEPSYWNRRVIDGGTQRLSVTADGKTHQVTVHHYQVTRFNAIVSALEREVGGK